MVCFYPFFIIRKGGKWSDIVENNFFSKNKKRARKRGEFLTSSLHRASEGFARGTRASSSGKTQGRGIIHVWCLNIFKILWKPWGVTKSPNLWCLIIISLIVYGWYSYLVVLGRGFDVVPALHRPTPGVET